MSYQQLTEENRYQISVLLAQGCSATAIAGVVEVHRSTGYPESKGNGNREGDEPSEAHQKAVLRRTNSAKYRMLEQVVQFVELTLYWLWSPKQISGVGKLIGLSVSHEWVYRHVAADKTCGGKRHYRSFQYRQRKDGTERRTSLPGFA